MSVFAALTLAGESVQDENIARVYRADSLGPEMSARLSPFAGAPVAILRELEVGLTVGYRRIGGTLLDGAGAHTADPTWISYAPVSVLVGPRFSFGKVDVGCALGPTWVVWAEAPGQQDVGYNGTKFGAVGEITVRVDPRAFLSGPPVASLMRLEAGVGGRWTPRPSGDACGGAPCGLDFGAPRVTLGVALELP